MPSDAQVRRILSLFDGLMPRPRVACCLLLGPRALGRLGLRVSNSLRVRAMFFSTAASSDSAVLNFSFAVNTASVLSMRARTSSARSSGRRARFAIIARRERFEVGRSGIKRVQIGKLFQKIAIGSFALLSAPLYAGKFAFAPPAVLFAWFRFWRRGFFSASSFAIAFACSRAIC